MALPICRSFARPPDKTLHPQLRYDAGVGFVVRRRLIVGDATPIPGTRCLASSIR